MSAKGVRRNGLSEGRLLPISFSWLAGCLRHGRKSSDAGFHLNIPAQARNIHCWRQVTAGKWRGCGRIGAENRARVTHFASRVGSNLSISQSLRGNHRLSGSKFNETNLVLQKLSSLMAAKLAYLASPKVSHLSTKLAPRLNANSPTPWGGNGAFRREMCLVWRARSGRN